MARSKFNRSLPKLLPLCAAALLAQLWVLPYGAGTQLLAQGVTLELDEVTAAIKGNDVTIHARTSAEVDQVTLYIRPLFDIDQPFNDLPMEKTGGTTWRYTLPLSQEADPGRLEYYVEAFRGGQSVARSENLVLSFIDPPFVGELAMNETVGLEKEDWKLFIKGRISRPFYKRWWVYAIAGAVAIPVTAVLAGGGEDPIEPVQLSLTLDETAVYGTFQRQLCPETPIPFTLTIRGGATPFDVIFVATNSGANNINQLGARGVPIVVQGGVRRALTADASGVTVVPFSFPGLTVSQSAGLGFAPVEFRAIVRDEQSKQFSSNPVEGQPLPAGIADDLNTDTRIRDVTFTESVVPNANATAIGCPAR